MKKTIAMFSVFFICLIILSCATVKFTPTGKIFPPHSGPVKIFKTLPTGLKYEEIGWVSADGDFNHPWAELLCLMQKEAASKGANALIIEERFTTKLDAEINVARDRSEDRTITAIAIRIFD